MLDPHDAELCQRDRALPGLAWLLDPAAIACILQDATPQAKVRQIKPTYLRYKPGEMCLAAYEVLAGDQRVLLHAIAGNAQSHEKYSKLTGPGPVRSSPLPGHVVIREQGLVLNTYPNDRELKTLRRIFEPDRLGRLLNKLDPSVNPADTTLGVLTYKPGRRLVARISTSGRDWGVLRVYCEKDFADVLARSKAFESRGALRLPRLLGKSRWQCALGMEYLPGTSLATGLADGTDRAEDAMECVGRALADLHAQKADLLPPIKPADVTRRLSEMSDWVAWVHPPLGPQACSIGKTIADRARRAWEFHVTSHGDFHAGQVLLPSDRSDATAILDLDEACLQPLEMDIANFAAHLEAECLRGRMRGEIAERLIDRLRRSYCLATGGEPSPSWPVYRALALFRLVSEPFRRRETPWPDLMRRFLARTQHWLEKSTE